MVGCRGAVAAPFLRQEGLMMVRRNAPVMRREFHCRPPIRARIAPTSRINIRIPKRFRAGMLRISAASSGSAVSGRPETGSPSSGSGGFNHSVSPESCPGPLTDSESSSSVSGFGVAADPRSSAGVASGYALISSKEQNRI